MFDRIAELEKEESRLARVECCEIRLMKESILERIKEMKMFSVGGKKDAGDAGRERNANEHMRVTLDRRVGWLGSLKEEMRGAEDERCSGIRERMGEWIEGADVLLGAEKRRGISDGAVGGVEGLRNIVSRAPSSD